MGRRAFRSPVVLLGLIACALALPLRAEVITVPEQEPANDHCPGQSVGGSTYIHPAAVDDGWDWDYYTFTATAGTPITVGTTDPGGFPYSDTIIDLFASNCTTILRSDGDSGPGNYSLIYRYIAPYSGLYHLRVRGAYSNHSLPYDGFVFVGEPPAGACCVQSGECILLDRVMCDSQGGLFFGEESICEAVECPLNPPNDTCVDAIAIPVPGSGLLQGNTCFSHDDYDPWAPSCTGLPAGGRDVVFQLDLAPGDIVDLTYRQTTANASVYLVTDCSDVSNSCVAGADKNGYAEEERILHVAGTPPPGACCFYGGGCALLPEEECVRNDGIWRGVWTDCDPNYCYLLHGACCLPDGGCLDMDPWECGAVGGDYLGEAILCYWQPCPRPPGACCFDGGTCSWIDGQSCSMAGGLFLGEEVACDPNPCDPDLGACCYPEGRCEVLHEEECALAGGEYQGSLVSCDEVPCGGALGACCLHDGYCEFLTAQQCALYLGQYLGEGVPCYPNPCPASKGTGGARMSGAGATHYLILDSVADGSGGDWTLDYTITRPADLPDDPLLDPAATPLFILPNPSRGVVRIRLSAQYPEVTRIEIFDAGGRSLRRIDSTARDLGRELEWDGTDDGGSRLPAGVYFLQVAGGFGKIVTPIVRLD